MRSPALWTDRARGVDAARSGRSAVGTIWGDDDDRRRPRRSVESALVRRLHRVRGRDAVVRVASAAPRCGPSSARSPLWTRGVWLVRRGRHRARRPRRGVRRRAPRARGRVDRPGGDRVAPGVATRWRAGTGAQVDSPRHGSADHRRVQVVEQPSCAAVRDQPQPHRDGSRALPLGRRRGRRSPRRRARSARLRARWRRRACTSTRTSSPSSSAAARAVRACKR